MAAAAAVAALQVLRWRRRRRCRVVATSCLRSLCRCTPAEIPQALVLCRIMQTRLGQQLYKSSIACTPEGIAVVMNYA